MYEPTTYRLATQALPCPTGEDERSAEDMSKEDRPLDETDCSMSGKEEVPRRRLEMLHCLWERVITTQQTVQGVLAKVRPLSDRHQKLRTRRRAARDLGLQRCTRFGLPFDGSLKGCFV